jgi:hypothetical protein
LDSFLTPPISHWTPPLKKKVEKRRPVLHFSSILFSADLGPKDEEENDVGAELGSEEAQEILHIRSSVGQYQQAAQFTGTVSQDFKPF